MITYRPTMVHNICKIVCIIFLANASTTSGMTMDNNFIRHCVKFTADSTEIKTTKKLTCAAECARMSNCDAFTYDKNTHVCKMAQGGSFGDCLSQPQGYMSAEPRPRSCRDLVKRRPTAPSGEYYLVTTSGETVKAYCEFALGDPVTFFSPLTYYILTQEDIDYVQTNKEYVLFRALKVDGSQPFGTASQLTMYQQYPVMALLNNCSTTFVCPHGAHNIGEPYLYIGFIPRDVAASLTTQGFRLNGQAVEFINCDRHPASYFAFFANYPVTDPPSTANRFNTSAGVGATMMSHFNLTSTISPMPTVYFSFMELAWGGCGCHATTADGDATLKAMSVGLC